MFVTLIIIVHLIVCFFLIGVVLLQQGQGADIASAFGGGGGQAAFGARSGATLMHKLTVTAFVLFLITSMALVVVNRREGPSVVNEVKQEQPAQKEEKAPATPPAAPAGETPASQDENPAK